MTVTTTTELDELLELSERCRQLRAKRDELQGHTIFVRVCVYLEHVDAGHEDLARIGLEHMREMVSEVEGLGAELEAATAAMSAWHEARRSA